MTEEHNKQEAKRRTQTADRKARQNTLVVVDGRYLICPQTAAELVLQCDLLAGWTVDRYLRGMPCSDVEELIGRMVVAKNRMLRSRAEQEQLKQCASIALEQLKAIREKWPLEPMRRQLGDRRGKLRNDPFDGEATADDGP